MQPATSVRAALPGRADQAREDPRRRRADQPVLAVARRRGVRDARRDVQRADGVRLPAGHGHGVLVQRRPAQPDDRPRALPREPRGDPQDVDRGRPRPPRRRVLQLPLPQRVAAADAEAATRRSTSSARAARRPSTSPPTSAPATRSSSRRSSSSSRRWPTSARRPRPRAGRSSRTTRSSRSSATSPTPTRRPCARRARTSRSSSPGCTACRRSSSRRPGYVSRAEFLRRAQSAALADGTRATWDDMVSIGRIICGSPDTVADTLSHWAQEAQCSRMLMVLQHGDMPEWKAVKNMHMFAKEVIPRVRARSSSGEAGQGPGGGEVAMASYTRGALRPARHRDRRADRRRGRPARLPARRRHGHRLRRAAAAGRALQAHRALPSRASGPSADDTTVDDIHDYRRHYLDLLDELGLEEFALAGHSLGGWLAANFAADHAERVTRLVLAAPFGMKVDEHPTTGLPRDPGRPAGPVPDRGPVDLRRARADAADPGVPGRSLSRDHVGRAPACGRAPTTSSCTAGCTG